MSAEIVPFKKSPKQEMNDMLIARIVGVPAVCGTPESDADPRNPNIVITEPAAGPAAGPLGAA